MFSLSILLSWQPFWCALTFEILFNPELNMINLRKKNPFSCQLCCKFVPSSKLFKLDKHTCLCAAGKILLWFRSSTWEVKTVSLCSWKWMSAATCWSSTAHQPNVSFWTQICGRKKKSDKRLSFSSSVEHNNHLRDCFNEG